MKRTCRTILSQRILLDRRMIFLIGPGLVGKATLSLVGDQGQKAENFAAAHLLKAVNWWTDNGYGFV